MEKEDAIRAVNKNGTTYGEIGSLEVELFDGLKEWFEICEITNVVTKRKITRVEVEALTWEIA